MTAHTWAIVEVDGGPMGIGEFWHCAACGAGGGSVWPTWPAPNRQFLANGSGLELPDDCDQAKAMVEAFRKGYAYALQQIPAKVRTRFKIRENV